MASATGLNLSSLYQNEIPDVIRSLPGGHMVEDYRGATMSPPRAQAERPRGSPTSDMMKKRHGEEKAAALLGDHAAAGLRVSRTCSTS